MVKIKSILLALISCFSASIVSNTNITKNTLANNDQPLIGELNYYKWEVFPGVISNAEIISKPEIILHDWTSFANSWEAFIKRYNQFTFNSQSKIEAMSSIENQNNSNLNADTSKILEKPSAVTGIYIQKGNEGLFSRHLVINASIQLWHDQNNIYLSTYIYETNYLVPGISSVKISLNAYCFYHQS